MMKKAYHVPLHTRLMRLILRPLFRGVFRLLSRVKIEGTEHIPSSGPYLITVNHVSLFEPPFVLAFWPTAAEAAGAVDIWDRTGQSILARLYGGIPVHRGEYDRKLIEMLLGALRSGRPLLIAPEGGRSHSLGMRRALPGAAYLAEREDALVVPVGVSGTSDRFLKDALDRKRPEIVMRVGEPFKLPQVQGKGDARRAERQKNADLIMKKIAELLPLEYHGVYSCEIAAEQD